MSAQEIPDVTDHRTVTTQGTSAAMTLSPELLDALAIERGDSLKVVKFPSENFARVYPDE